MARVIMHADLDAFFCSVEELHDRTLHGKPFVVGGSPQGRGVVSSASYAARAFGIRSAMPTAQALRLCPSLVIVSRHPRDYGSYSHRVMAILRDYSRAFQQISIDEAFLDVTGLLDTPNMIAREIQQRVRDEVQLPVSLGVASNKLVAKLASGRAKPNSVLVVPTGEEFVFVAPMPVEELWGVGKVTAAQLKALGIATIGALAASDPKRLRNVFGKHSEQMVERARGIDDSTVVEESRTSSISSERTFATDIKDKDQLHAALLAMCDEVAFRLRTEGYYASTVQLKLRWTDFTTITRQTSLPSGTQLSDELFAAIEQLWLKAWRHWQPVRLLGVGVSDLSRDAEQLTLFDYEKRNQRLALAQTTDKLRAKYGRSIIGRASQRSTKR